MANKSYSVSSKAPPKHTKDWDGNQKFSRRVHKDLLNRKIALKGLIDSQQIHSWNALDVDTYIFLSPHFDFRTFYDDLITEYKTSKNNRALTWRYLCAIIRDDDVQLVTQVRTRIQTQSQMLGQLRPSIVTWNGDIKMYNIHLEKNEDTKALVELGIDPLYFTGSLLALAHDTDLVMARLYFGARLAVVIDVFETKRLR